MKKYKKTYELSKNEVINNLSQRIMPFRYAYAAVRGYGGQEKGRVFLGKIYNSSFEILTYPDQWLSFESMFLSVSPVYVVGKVYEAKNKTVVEYVIRKPDVSYVAAAFLVVIEICTLFSSYLSIQKGESGKFDILVAIIMTLIAIMFIRVPHSEEEEVHKMMGELDQSNQE
ncbi:MAG: hypothetical protein SOX11_07100 [Lachnospiraceae bacterium]|nr:hypothetical protein [Lachnospiraceae bacterium]MDY3222891.1 hypothetical protein [Lachnospiraceae bacterium]